MNAESKNKPDLLSAIANNVFSLTLLPTEKCNFRCTYCYEDFELGKMPVSVEHGVKNLIAKRIDELGWLNIDWFGGEPLANLPTVLNISSYAKDLARKHKCHFTSGMTTNAYLLKLSILEKLVGSGVTHYQISLDGPEHLHNKTRLRADGSGTFGRIWHNLEAMAKTDYPFNVTLRVHVTPENHAELPALIEKINRCLGDDTRFHVFLKAIANLGGANAGQFSTLTGEAHDRVMRHLSGLVKSKEIDVGKKRPYICYASKTNSLIIRANGRIAKCTVAFSDDRNDIGNINEDGSLTLDQKKLQPWVRGLISGDTSILACPLHGLPAVTKEIPVNDVNRIPTVSV